MVIRRALVVRLIEKLKIVAPVARYRPLTEQLESSETHIAFLILRSRMPQLNVALPIVRLYVLRASGAR